MGQTKFSGSSDLEGLMDDEEEAMVLNDILVGDKSLKLDRVVRRDDDPTVRAGAGLSGKTAPASTRTDVGVSIYFSIRRSLFHF